MVTNSRAQRDGVRRRTLVGPLAGPVVGALLAALTLTSCSDGTATADTPTDEVTTPGGSTTTPTAPDDDATSDAGTTPDPGTAAPDDDAVGGEFSAPGTTLEQEPRDGMLSVTDVRTGVHDGFERIVYELQGEGLPGWRVGYVDDAVEDPSGESIDVAGDAVLQVVLLGTTYPTDVPEPDEDVLGSGAVREVTRPLTFEGQTQSFVGLDEQRAVRVTLVEDPVRVVIDVEL